ncbi:MAG: hypothetical protein OEZ03_17175, partial [Alphaproteobacteria bacterium]|nr:hypothetical protein [Alphaproteobacteria bacterium]
MADNIYTGRFSVKQVESVLDAAAPIPEEPLEILGADGKASLVPRAEVVVKRLEWLDAVIQMNLRHDNDLPPSALAKSAHAISAAA